MEKELIKVNENWHTIKCLKEMRKQANDLKSIYTIYVVNDEDIQETIKAKTNSSKS